MCDDLVAKHFLHSAPSHVLHPSPAGTTHFTLKPSGHVWVFGSGDSTADGGALDELRPRWTTINSYDGAIADWAAEWHHSVSKLKEMKLSVPTTGGDDAGGDAGGGAGEAGLPGLPELPELPGLPELPELPAGFKPSPTLPTKQWYLSTFPAQANTVHKAGELVFSVSDHAKSIPRRAGWIAVLPDPPSRRLYISTLHVLEPYRRRGLARWLVASVARWWAAAGPGPGEVWLTVFDSNDAALGLYRGLGFGSARDLWVVQRAGTKRRLSVKADEWGLS